jgi:hypothetical protein
MRTHFELKVYADDLVSAKEKAYSLVSDFLGISRDDVSSHVDLELKVKTYELKEDQVYPDGEFEVLVYGNVKNNILKPLSV